MSLPVRERGLKFNSRPAPQAGRSVAPCAGAWVEIILVTQKAPKRRCRSLCGSVG